MKVFTAAIAASNGVAPRVGGVAADSGPMVVSSLRRVCLEVPWGRNLLVSDGDFVNIGGLHNLEGGEAM